MASSFERNQLQLALWAALPSLLFSLSLLWLADVNLYLKWLISLWLSLSVAYCLYRLNDRLRDQFTSLANLVEALNIGDFSLRAKACKGETGHSDLVAQLNLLADALTAARFEYKESQLLLAKLIKQIGVIVFACDEELKISLANPAAEQFFEKPESKLINLTLKDLNLLNLTEVSSNQLVTLEQANKQSRWHLYRDVFREGGKQHSLFILSDMETVLNRQEQKAWQDLVRVLSHEINNSLSPIISLTATLNKLLTPISMEDEDKHDIVGGLDIIGERAQRLKQFIDGYRQLTSLPSPARKNIDIVLLVNKIIDLLGYKIILRAPNSLNMPLDESQIEQCLINLLKNAYEASPATDIHICINLSGEFIELSIRDFGPGIAIVDNLFVPLFTTKKTGTGIGLSLCKQIVQGHNGQLFISNHEGGGCLVRMVLPLT